MKKIVFLFFTFSGICTAQAQKPADSSGKSTVINDSLPKKERPAIRLFPNPAMNKVEIEITGFDPGYLQVQIIDMNGNKIRDDKRSAFKGNEIIVLMFAVNPGIYLLQVRQDKKLARTKLIVR